MVFKKWYAAPMIHIEDFLGQFHFMAQDLPYL